jgi:hypothetical protein
MVTLSFPGIDLEGSNPIAYTLLSSSNQTTLNNLAIEGPFPSFDFPPGDVAVLSPDIPVGGYHVYSLQLTEITIAGIANGMTLYFRVRACDNIGNCSASLTMSGKPVAQNVLVSIGSTDTVFDWSVQQCNELDLPDNPARFFRNNNGTLTLVAGNAPNVYVTKAPTFSTAALTAPGAHICSSPALPSTDNSFPYTFNNQEWIFATYKEGSTVHAIIHNEFHDTTYGDPCLPAVSTPNNPCWYNVLTHASSLNEGASFTQSSPPPSNLIAAPPDPWNPGAIAPPFDGGPYFYGYQGSTNVVQKDGYYYTIFVRETDPDNALAAKSGHCIMRTNNLNDPSSWRAWDGKGFDYVMNAPYDSLGNPDPITNADGCARLSVSELSGYFGRGLTYNTSLLQYVLVGEGIVGSNCGFFFSLSPDLITWSPAKFLMSGKVQYGSCWDNNPAGLTPYPTFVDHSDASTNFEFTDEDFFVYYTYFMYEGDNFLDRDLRRTHVTISTP